jgi:hypothetical protein
MMNRAIPSLLLLCALVLPAQDDSRRIIPFGGRRTALIIGNQAYPWKPLVNPVNDAKAVAGTLQELGFPQRDIRLVLDARQAGDSGYRQAISDQQRNPR